MRRRAVPMVTKELAPEFSLETFKVLQPQITKIRRLMEFHEKGIVIIERCMKALVSKEARERVVPGAFPRRFLSVKKPQSLFFPQGIRTKGATRDYLEL